MKFLLQADRLRVYEAGDHRGPAVAVNLAQLEVGGGRSCKAQFIDPEQQRLRPYLVGLIGGFMGCMLTMSLTDMLPTYTLLGTITVFR